MNAPPRAVSYSFASRDTRELLQVVHGTGVACHNNQTKPKNKTRSWRRPWISTVRQRTLVLQATHAQTQTQTQTHTRHAAKQHTTRRQCFQHVLGVVQWRPIRPSSSWFQRGTRDSSTIETAAQASRPRILWTGARSSTRRHRCRVQRIQRSIYIKHATSTREQYTTNTRTMVVSTGFVLPTSFCILQEAKLRLVPCRIHSHRDTRVLLHGTALASSSQAQ